MELETRLHGFEMADNSDRPQQAHTRRWHLVWRPYRVPGDESRADAMLSGRG